MVSVRTEFEQGLRTLKKEEEEAIKIFGKNKVIHNDRDSNLHEEANLLTTEKQSTEEAIDSTQNDRVDHEGEVTSAQEYLRRLGSSCTPLLEHFDERKKLRKEEQKSIKDAIKVLKSV